MRACFLTFSLGLLLTESPAQEPAPAWSVLARVEARGGEVADCCFDRNGARMLTVGEEGDVVAWDLAGLRELARWPLPQRYLTALALHPDGDVAVVATTAGDFAQGQLHRLDLPTGERRALGGSYVQALAFERSGGRLVVVRRPTPEARAVRVEIWPTVALAAADGAPAFTVDVPELVWSWAVFAPDGTAVVLSDLREYSPGKRHVRVPLDGGAPVTGEGAVVAFGPDGAPIMAEGGRRSWNAAADGTFVVRCGTDWSDRTVERLGPDAHRWDLGARTDSWLQRVWAAPGGRVVAGDVQGQLHVLGPEREAMRVTSAHRGEMTGLVWSPDGRFLAVQAMGGLRVVAADGTPVREFAGSHGVLPGAAGPEFTLADRDGIRRWNAAVDRDVGAAVAFRGGAPALLGDRPRALTLEDPLYAAMAWRPLGSGWLCGAGTVGGKRVDLVRVGADGEVVAVPEAGIEGLYFGVDAGEMLGDPRGGHAVVAWFTQSGGCGTGMVGSTVFGAVRAFDSEGAERAARGFREGVWWLRRLPSGAVLAGLGDGALAELDPLTLEERRRVPGGKALRWLEVLPDGRMLGGDGERAWWIEGQHWQRRTAKLPDGLGAVRLSALAPDGRTLALGSGCEAWIVRLP